MCNRAYQKATTGGEASSETPSDAEKRVPGRKRSNDNEQEESGLQGDIVGFNTGNG